MKHDWHIHTFFSPCASPDMRFSAIVAAALDAGLESVGFSDHPFREGLAAHHEKIDEFRRKMYVGVKVFISAELEVIGPGELVLDPADLPLADYIIAAPSHYNVLKDPPVEDMTDADQWAVRMVNDFANVAGSGADIVAHPFYAYSVIFNEPKGMGLPSIESVLHAIDRTKLRDALEAISADGVALEVSYRAHSHPALKGFLQGMFLEAREFGIKFSFGSDAHRLQSVGLFEARTMEFMEGIGLREEELWRLT